ncbi:nuclear transport factor 2 family protein [Gordonia sp. NPDC127522]|uniref:nuclear transport factor 2 family protein n=1 Tax=Gordonia sp. NPDC127522 TaxID=3345390 RepID=UPI003635B850
MATPEILRAAMHSYLDAVNSGGGKAVLELFAENGTVEDPVGSPPVLARDFFATPFEEVHVQLVSPVSTSLDCSAAAMAFTLVATIEGEQLRINVVDVMQFDEAGLITSMRAHWGPSDATPI